MKRFWLGCLLVAITGTVAHAETVLVMDDFESYNSDADLFQVWRPANGNSTVYWTPSDPAYAQAALLDANYNPNAFPMGGKGVGHLGGFDSGTNTAVLEWNGLSSANAIHPTATQHIVFGGDIFDSGNNTNNRRLSIALRSTAPANLVELGFWNANTCDPTVTGCTPGAATGETPGFYPATQYAARTALFGARGAPLVAEPNWQYWQLPTELDRETDADTIVNKPDIGEGWHRFVATIGPDFVKLEIDLFRDGLRNTSITPDPESGIRPGTPGVDATMMWPITTTAAGYNSLRFGGPSGLTSLENPGGNEAIFDNIFLKLVDVMPPDLVGDYNEDGKVDAADYVLWRKDPASHGGDPGGYNAWRANFGMMAGGGSGLAVAGAVPEPAALALLLLGLAALASSRRSR